MMTLCHTVILTPFSSILSYIYMCGSGSTKLLNTDPIRIRTHNTGVDGVPNLFFLFVKSEFQSAKPCSQIRIQYLVYEKKITKLYSLKNEQLDIKQQCTVQ